MLFRLCLAIGLTLMIAATTASMAVARTGMGFGGTITFCMGTVTVEIPLGADGTPQEHAHICPDCVIGALALPETVSLPRKTEGLAWVNIAPVWPGTPTLRPHHGGSARAPPA